MAHFQRENNTTLMLLSALQIRPPSLPADIPLWEKLAATTVRRFSMGY